MFRFPFFLLALVLALPAFAQTAPLAFQNLELLTDQDQPAACLVFDRKLAPGNDNLAAYLTITPNDDLAIKQNNDRLCLEGLKFGQRYEVTLKAGLKAEDGGETEELKQTIDVPDRQPGLSFKSSGVVLPKVGGEGLPLRSVNVDSAKVQILRINDRNLVGAIGNGKLNESLSKYAADYLANDEGERLYEGTLDIRSEKNAWVTTSLPVRDVLKTVKPGIYVALAANAAPDKEGRDWRDMATQWFIISDLGLSSFQGEDGLAVVARALSSAQNLANVKLSLYSRNNSLLGAATTDKTGLARFAPGLLRGAGGNAPQLVMAERADGDFAFLNLTGSQISLSDRGVSGRRTPGPLDGYLTTERGIYRPGETIHATLLLRDRALKAVTGLPLTLKITRPDGAEFETRTINETASGAYSFDFATETASMSGTWNFAAYTDPTLPPVGTASFLVDDFQPPRLEFNLAAKAPAIDAKGTGTVNLDGRFLYGAPAAGLTGQANVALAIAAAPFASYQDYRFGLEEEKFLPVRADLAPFTTDENGKAAIAVALGRMTDTSHPLEARVTAQLFDVGGRPVERSITLPVWNTSENIGIKPDTASFKSNSTAGFDIIALDGAGQPKARAGLVWNLYREHYDYYWYRMGGDWNYEPNISSLRSGSGKLDIRADKPAHLDVPLEDGYYRLEVRDAENGKLASSVRFTAGWWASPDAINKPDAVTVTRNTETAVQAGDSLTVHVKAPYEAAVTVLTATHNTGAPVLQNLPEAGGNITLKVPAEAATGFYVLVSAVQKPTAVSSTPPRRAMGVLWVPLDPSPHQLKATIDAPELVKPNQTIEARVKVEGAGSEPVHVVLAAVDDGVLQLTDYQSPNPERWYLGQRALEVTLRDIYGDLIDSSGAAKGELHQGGDMSAARQLKGLPQQTVKVVSLYSGIVKAENGVATIPLALPDFNGRLRLMAMAFTPERVGQAETQITVRAPVVADLMLPRFLAPGDEAAVALSLDNRDAAAGTYNVKLTGSGPVTLAGGTAAVELKTGERKSLPLVLKATTVGEAGFDLTVTGPDNFSLTRHFNISVRAGNPTVTRQAVTLLKPGEAVTILAALPEEFLAGTTEGSYALSALPEMNVPGLLKALNRYPYGCAEQTTSTAMPLLYLNDVAEGLGLGSDATLRSRVRDALAKLATIQRNDGGFGLWSARDNYEIWLTAYIADFITRAGQQGYKVAESLTTGTLKRLNETLKNETPDERDITARAYAYYALARAGQVEAADLRYFADTYGAKLQTRLARVQLAVALKLAGDASRSGKTLTEMNQLPESKIESYYDYGSSLRDDAAVLTLLAENDMAPPETLLNLAGNLAAARNNNNWLSTQEQSWLLLATHALMQKTGARLQVTLNGEALDSKEPIYRTLAEGEAKIENKGANPLYQVVTISGVPVAPQPPETHGFAIHRSFYTPNGQPADLNQVRQNDLLVVVLDGKTDQTYSQAALVVDMLPAGFEIENVRISGNNQMADMAWLGENITTPRTTEFRSDRYVGALDLGDWYNTKTFKLVYLVRAVTPGIYFQPGAFIEDMYRPANFAREASGMVRVAPAE